MMIIKIYDKRNDRLQDFVSLGGSFGVLNLFVKGLDELNEQISVEMSADGGATWFSFIDANGSPIVITSAETIVKFNPDNCIIRLSSNSDTSQAEALL
jgi:hypothetical protein